MLNFFLPLLYLMVQYSNAQDFDKIELKDTYPWCIVAYDSLKRSPAERIQMIKELGFNKYAYDWRDSHLNDTYTELKLATESNIEVISVWVWLNAKRDSLYRLSASNEQIFATVEQMKLKTTFWVSFSENFFKDLNQEQSIKKAVEMVDYIATKAGKIGCQVALYNHSGWFGNPYNQLKIVNALPIHQLRLVYNFHHAHNSIDEFPKIVKTIKPYLSAVNLNGMQRNGEKILTIGEGNYEKEMINILRKSGFDGPWGILGHVEDADVRIVLENNLHGLWALQDH
ncbi:MAG: TIM barrel protein [Eudoraea sp.]|nr:TIM barrel protein [Eudoraea sp.]